MPPARCCWYRLSSARIDGDRRCRRVVLLHVFAPGEQERGREEKETGDRDRGAGIGEGGQHAP